MARRPGSPSRSAWLELQATRQHSAFLQTTVMPPRARPGQSAELLTCGFSPTWAHVAIVRHRRFAARDGGIRNRLHCTFSL